jgi:hypothetical protein
VRSRTPSAIVGIARYGPMHLRKLSVEGTK